MEPDRGMRRAQSMGISPTLRRLGGRGLPGEQALLKGTLWKWNEHVSCMLLSRDCARRGSSYSTIPYGGPLQYKYVRSCVLCCCFACDCVLELVCLVRFARVSCPWLRFAEVYSSKSIHESAHSSHQQKASSITILASRYY